MTDIASTLGTVSVELEQLDEFSRRIRELAEGISDLGSAGVLNPLVDTPVNFAGGGLAEGSSFFSPYMICVRRLGEFFGEALQGITTLSAVAQLAAVHYVTGDTESAELLATVTAAFTPPPPNPVAEAMIAEDQRRREARDDMAEAHFDDLVEDYRDGGTPNDGERDEFELPYSDYYTPATTPLRGDGRVWPHPPGWTEPDVQHVRTVDLPAPGESVLDGVDLRDLTPAEYRDQVDDALDEWNDGDGDFPGTSDDEQPGEGHGRDPIL